MGKMLKLAWFATKAGLAAGTVYVTVDQGVWGTPDQTAALAQRLYKDVPGIQTLREEYIGDFLPKDFGNINYKDHWNSAVLGSFNFLADSPAKLVKLKDYLLETVTSFMAENVGQGEAKRA